MTKPLNVGEVRSVLATLPDEMEIVLEAWVAGDVGDGDVVQVAVQSAKVETRCDEKPALYLSGDASELACDRCMSTTGARCSAHSEPETEER